MKKISTALLAVIAVGASHLSAHDNIYSMQDFAKGGRLHNLEKDAIQDYKIANPTVDANQLSKSQTFTILEGAKTELSQEESAFSYKDVLRSGASYLTGIAGVAGAYYLGVPAVFWGVYKGTVIGLNVIGITGFTAMSGATNLAVMAAGSPVVKAALMAGCGAAATAGASLVFDAAELLGKAAVGTYKLVGEYFFEDKPVLAPVELSKEELRQKRLQKFDRKAAVEEPTVTPKVETTMEKTAETVKAVAKSAWSYLGNAYTALTEKLAPKSEQAAA
ncbi:hypothetical protein [Candidatus Odyssella acanthamoebae]|uniref:Uncharacterized protein n=1 Tax=Candidatus Odyssella acanthamoebae TaxID=91604 RepID=A0A077B283_9PROT|nr:hypothetical protein [Candidatus Paracaedibacter acanthamoebae]AIK97080.1 hypothetical protein ID47_10595 [Candidatus Paracaedibacter acanthamoebae]